MSSNHFCYRQNYTGECLYYIDLEECILEVIYKFEEEDLVEEVAREMMEVSFGFAKTLMDKLFFLDPMVFDHYRKMSLAHHRKDHIATPGKAG